MKIRTAQLRRIIRETLDEQGWVPGRWYPADGEPVDHDDFDAMGTGGLGQEEEDLMEAALTVKGLKKSNLEEFKKKFPEFMRYLGSVYKDQLATASFAVSPQGMMGLGGKIPAVAFKRYSEPVVYWEDGGPKFNSSDSLADAIRGLNESTDVDQVRQLVRAYVSEAKKRGLWANIHARRAAGKRPKRPGEKGYPKTLDIDEGDNEAKNQ